MKKGSSNRHNTLVHQNSSTLGSSLTNGKLKQLQGQQDEANLKLLRELSHLPANKFCFDCGQRGPNYVDVTIGSFVCMTCSGLLRGLTPPHRVKSISMASFSADELELLKTHGNEYCRRVWLATCSSKESKLGPENDPERLNNIKAFMSAKYEQKRYYIDPSRFPKGELEQIHQETSRSLQQQQQSNHIQKSPSLSSSTHSSNPSPSLNNTRLNNRSPNTNSRMINSITLPEIKPLSSLLGSSPSLSSELASLNGLSTGTSKSNNSTPSNFINNLTNGNSMPWDGSSSTGTSTNGEFANFADFDDAFNNLPANSSSNIDFAFMNGDKNAFPTQSVPIPTQKNHLFNGGSGIPFPGMQSTPLVPSGHSSNVSSVTSNHNQDSSSVMKASNATQDKYAALKDLDSLFKQSTSDDNENTTVNNGPSLPSLPNSASLPVNLSSSGNINNETGWFSSSANPPNPFSQASPSNKANGWPAPGASTSVNANPHNPFYNPNGWQSSMSSSNTFCNGMNTSAFGAPSQTNFGGGMIGAGSKTVNPFFTPAKPNPNNPFL